MNAEIFSEKHQNYRFLLIGAMGACLAFLLCATRFVAAATPSTWAFTGPLAEARAYHTATVNRGEVLITGGVNHYGDLASAEIFDFHTGKFAPTGPMKFPRSHHTATPVLGGVRILIAGGSVTAAELFNQGTGKFDIVGSMSVARMNCTATLLPDGRVLFVGGSYETRGGRIHINDSAEVFDPYTGTFSLTGKMGTARTFHTATLLHNGKVLIAGGITMDSLQPGVLRATDTVELFDPITGTFSPTATLAGARAFHTSTLLPDGKVLVAGGSSAPGGEPLGAALIYDSDKGAFQLIQAGSIPRLGHTATLLPTGKVLLAGGDGVCSSELFDPMTGTFAATDPMRVSRQWHAAALLPDGTVLATGGRGDSSELKAEAYSVDLSAVDPRIEIDTYYLELSKANQIVNMVKNQGAWVLAAKGQHVTIWCSAQAGKLTGWQVESWWVCLQYNFTTGAWEVWNDSLKPVSQGAFYSYPSSPTGLDLGYLPRGVYLILIGADTNPNGVFDLNLMSYDAVFAMIY